MAGSRLPNFGTIFSRTTGLLKSGALKEVPLWYDVYRKYPPVQEPDTERPPPPQDPIPEIVYEEDFDRAILSKNNYKNRQAREKSRLRLSSIDIVADISKE